MKYKRFEDLPVWQDAIELAVRIFALTARPNFKGYGGLRIKLNGPLFRSQTTSLKASSAAQLPSC